MSGVEGEVARPNVRPLGYLALGLAVVGAVLVLTVVLSLVAVLPAGLAIALGVAARTEPSTRRTGTAAVVVGALALLGAAAVVIWMLTGDGVGY